MSKNIGIPFRSLAAILLVSCGWPEAKNRHEVTDRHIDGGQIINSVGKEDEDLKLATQYCNGLARQFGNFSGPPVNGRRGFECGNWVTGEPVVRLVANASNSPRNISPPRAPAQAVQPGIQNLEQARLEAIEMARAEAEKARREERSLRMMQLGLGMAAGAYSAPPPPQTRTYIINGRSFHCSTTGGITNCF